MTNRGHQPQTLVLPVEDIHFNPTAALRARDVWRHAEHKISGGRIVATLKPRETLMLRVRGTELNPGIRYLDEMPSNVRVVATGYKPAHRGVLSWIPARLGYLPTGKPILRDGRHLHDALATAEGARIEVAVPAGFKRFRALPDQPGEVLVIGDGRVLYRGGKDTVRPIDIDVSSIKSLSLSMPLATSNSGNPHIRVLYDVSFGI